MKILPILAAALPWFLFGVPASAQFTYEVTHTSAAYPGADRPAGSSYSQSINGTIASNSLVPASTSSTGNAFYANAYAYNSGSGFAYSTFSSYTDHRVVIKTPDPAAASVTKTVNIAFAMNATGQIYDYDSSHGGLGGTALIMTSDWADVAGSDVYDPDTLYYADNHTFTKSVSLTITRQQAPSGLYYGTAEYTLSTEEYVYASGGVGSTTVQASLNVSGVTVDNFFTYCVPSYTPTFWNDGSTIEWNNNCYNYSNNKRTDTFAQPGHAHGFNLTTINASDVQYGAALDGLEATNATATSPSGKTKIALVIAPGYDFHWYRKGPDGKWTHKPGGTPATNLDNSGNVITNPETADRGIYTQFVGYYFTPAVCDEGMSYIDIL